MAFRLLQYCTPDLTAKKLRAVPVLKGNESMIDCSKEAVTVHFGLLAEKLLSLPEIECVKVREVEIRREDRDKTVPLAVNACYHDRYSDIDLCAVVQYAEGGISPEDYVRHTERWGFARAAILGICFVPENCMYRIALKNGMRYDFGFAFVPQEALSPLHLPPMAKQEQNDSWPVENIDRFWFVAVQALGKLYRNDFLISSHLANLNINKTLVQQMVLRDLKHHTNHHRYGYGEEPACSRYRAQCPYRSGNNTFDEIAEGIYAAALACDELTPYFYEDYEPRSQFFFGIWDHYEASRNL